MVAPTRLLVLALKRYKHMKSWLKLKGRTVGCPATNDVVYNITSIWIQFAIMMEPSALHILTLLKSNGQIQDGTAQ